MQGKPSIDVTQFQTAANKAFESIGNLGSITFSVVDSEEMVTFLAAEDIITENINTDELIDESEKVSAHYYFPEADKQIGLSMITDKLTQTGCTLVFLQKDGNVTGQLQTGKWFEIQVKNANGEWIDNSTKDIEISWEDIAYDINKDGITELPLGWESIYGYLSDGHYRIVKKLMDYRSPGDYDEYDVYAEFDIGNGISSLYGFAVVGDERRGH